LRHSPSKRSGPAAYSSQPLGRSFHGFCTCFPHLWSPTVETPPTGPAGAS